MRTSIYQRNQQCAMIQVVANTINNIYNNNVNERLPIINDNYDNNLSKKLPVVDNIYNGHSSEKLPVIYNTQSLIAVE